MSFYFRVEMFARTKTAQIQKRCLSFILYLKENDNKTNNTLQVQDESKTWIPNKKTYLSTLREEKGSMTVEMVTAFPIFLFAVMTILLFAQMMMADQEVHRGMVECARQLAEQSHPEKTIVLAKTYWKKQVDTNYLDRSCIKNGTKGISFLGSYYDEKSGDIILKARYQMVIPFPLFHVLSYRAGHEVHQKVFRGYQFELEGEDEEYVYVTEHQSVYHTSRSCTYLQLNIKQVFDVQGYLDGKRGYSPCEFCIKKGEKPALLYVTEQGRRYHKTLSCSGLKRTVRRVKKRDVNHLSPCSRCGHKKEKME